MKTNAVRLLETLGVGYELRGYEVDPNDLAAESVAVKIWPVPLKEVQALTGYVRGGVTAIAGEGRGDCAREAGCERILAYTQSRRTDVCGDLTLYWHLDWRCLRPTERLRVLTRSSRQ